MSLNYTSGAKPFWYPGESCLPSGNNILKIGFVSLGCPKNLVDTEVMMGQLTARGHVLTPHPEEAEVLVVNTCSFIDPAKQESIDTILEMAKYKTEGNARKLIVAGCLVERYRDEIAKNLPEVDAVIGTNEIDAISAVCEGRPAGSHRAQPMVGRPAIPWRARSPSSSSAGKVDSSPRSDPR